MQFRRLRHIPGCKLLHTRNNRFPLDQLEVQSRGHIMPTTKRDHLRSENSREIVSEKRRRPLRTRVQNLMRPIVTNRKVTNGTTDRGSRYGILVPFEFHQSRIPYRASCLILSVSRLRGRAVRASCDPYGSQGASYLGEGLRPGSQGRIVRQSSGLLRTLSAGNHLLSTVSEGRYFFTLSRG